MLSVLLAILPAVLLGACTESTTPPSTGPSEIPTPELPATTQPETGLRMAVVIASSDTASAGVVQANQAAVSELRSARDDLARLEVAVGETGLLARDLAMFFADDGAELVCIVGPRARPFVVAIAPQHPDVSFCAVPAIQDPVLDDATSLPSNVFVVETDRGEVDQVEAYAAAAVTEPGAPAGLVTETEELAERIEPVLRAALQRQAPPVADPDADPEQPPAEVARVAFAVVGIDEAEVRAQIRAAYATGAQVVVVDEVPAALGAVAAARGRGLLVGPAAALWDVLDDPPAEVVVGHRQHVDVGLAVAIERFEDTTVEFAGSVTLGVNAGLVSFVAGGAPTAEQVLADALAFLAEQG